MLFRLSAKSQAGPSAHPFMKNQWNLDSGAFDKLLAWLSSTPEEAAHKYEEIRERLIRYFRGCREPDELADKTMDRVAKKLACGTLSYNGNPIPYFYGVAGVIYKEYLRKQKVIMIALDEDAPLPLLDTEGTEIKHRCMEQCMAKLPEKNRNLIHRYHGSSGAEKIQTRQMLAYELGIEMNALRIHVFKIRSMLRECIVKCTARTMN